MKLLGSTTSKITKDENGENVLRLEITETVLLVHYSIAILNISKVWGSSIQLFPINCFFNY